VAKTCRDRSVPGRQGYIRRDRADGRFGRRAPKIPELSRPGRLLLQAKDCPDRALPFARGQNVPIRQRVTALAERDHTFSQYIITRSRLRDEHVTGAGADQHKAAASRRPADTGTPINNRGYSLLPSDPIRSWLKHLTGTHYFAC
jgi:hypothetical protein